MHSFLCVFCIPAQIKAQSHTLFLSGETVSLHPNMKYVVFLHPLLYTQETFILFFNKVLSSDSSFSFLFGYQENLNIVLWIQTRARFFERNYNCNAMLVGCNIPLADSWIL